MINNTPLYIDLLDYLERDGIASLSNDFDPNAFMTNFDELDTTSPLINNPTVAPTMPYIIPPLGGGDGPRQGLESLREEDDDLSTFLAQCARRFGAGVSVFLNFRSSSRRMRSSET